MANENYNGPDLGEDDVSEKVKHTAKNEIKHQARRFAGSTVKKIGQKVGHAIVVGLKALLANPITWVVLGVGALFLIAVIVFEYYLNPMYKIQKAVNTIKESFNSIAEKVMEERPDSWDEITEKLGIEDRQATYVVDLLEGWNGADDPDLTTLTYYEFIYMMDEKLGSPLPEGAEKYIENARVAHEAGLEAYKEKKREEAELKGKDPAEAEEQAEKDYEEYWYDMTRPERFFMDDSNMEYLLRYCMEYNDRMFEMEQVWYEWTDIWVPADVDPVLDANGNQVYDSDGLPLYHKYLIVPQSAATRHTGTPTDEGDGIWELGSREWLEGEKVKHTEERRFALHWQEIAAFVQRYVEEKYDPDTDFMTEWESGRHWGDQPDNKYDPTITTRDGNLNNNDVENYYLSNDEGDKELYNIIQLFEYQFNYANEDVASARGYDVVGGDYCVANIKEQEPDEAETGKDHNTSGTKYDMGMGPDRYGNYEGGLYRGEYTLGYRYYRIPYIDNEGNRLDAEYNYGTRKRRDDAYVPAYTEFVPDSSPVSIANSWDTYVYMTVPTTELPAVWIGEPRLQVYYPPDPDEYEPPEGEYNFGRYHYITGYHLCSALLDLMPYYPNQQFYQPDDYLDNYNKGGRYDGYRWYEQLCGRLQQYLDNLPLVSGLTWPTPGLGSDTRDTTGRHIIPLQDHIGMAFDAYKDLVENNHVTVYYEGADPSSAGVKDAWEEEMKTIIQMETNNLAQNFDFIYDDSGELSEWMNPGGGTESYGSCEIMYEAKAHDAVPYNSFGVTFRYAGSDHNADPYYPDTWDQLGGNTPEYTGEGIFISSLGGHSADVFVQLNEYATIDLLSLPKVTSKEQLVYYLSNLNKATGNSFDFTKAADALWAWCQSHGGTNPAPALAHIIVEGLYRDYKGRDLYNFFGYTASSGEPVYVGSHNWLNCKELARQNGYSEENLFGGAITLCVDKIYRNYWTKGQNTYWDMCFQNYYVTGEDGEKKFPETKEEGDQANINAYSGNKHLYCPWWESAFAVGKKSEYLYPNRVGLALAKILGGS